MSDIRKKAKIRFIEFLRPNCFPYPYTIEQAFHTYLWFAKTGINYNKYGRSGVFDLLNKNPSCINCELWTDKIYSIEDLRERFHYVLLYDDEWNPRTTAWKKDNGIGIDKVKWIYFNHYTPFRGKLSERQIEESLENLLSKSTGKTLNRSLNDCHPQAKFIAGVWIRILVPVYTPKGITGFQFVLDYGYKNEGSWEHVLATTENDEPFTDTMLKAIAALESITEIKK